LFVSAASPTVTTNSTTNITETSATLNGFLSNDGGSNCSVWFEYGTTDSYGSTTTEDSVNVLEDDTEDSFYSTGDSLDDGSLANMHDEDWGTYGGYEVATADGTTHSGNFYENYTGISGSEAEITVKYYLDYTHGAGAIPNNAFKLYVYNNSAGSWDEKINENNKEYGVKTSTVTLNPLSSYINESDGNKLRTRVYLDAVGGSGGVSRWDGISRYYESKLTVYGNYSTGDTFNTIVTGLSSGTTYHYRSVANNSDGESYGSDMNFTTAMPQDNTTNGTTYMSLTSNDQDTSYYPVNRTIPSETTWLEYNNISFNPLLNYTTNVTLVVPVSSNNAVIFNVTNNTCGTEATSVSDFSSLTNNTYWYDSGNQLLYIRTINVTTSTPINWSIYSWGEYSFYIEIPQYLDVGDYFMAQGLITDALTDNPASGVIAKTYLYESGILAFGPVQWYCTNGNYQSMFSTNTLEPGTYSVDIVFENETSGNTYHYGSNLYLSTDTPISGVYKNAVVHISWYNTNYGLGLPDETLKLFIDDERKHSMTFYTYTGNTINITVKDYYNSTLYTGNHTITDTTTNIDLGLTFHSWLFGNKNEE
jgi:hypothetical protein